MYIKTIKVMANKKKHRFNFKEILSNIKVSTHFEEQLNKRFGKSSEEIDFSKFKVGSVDCPIAEVRNKVVTAPSNRMIAFNTYTNLLITVDMQTRLAITAMYLDGRDGYNL